MTLQTEKQDEKAWEELTPEEKREQRFEWYSNPQGVNFVSPEAEAAFKVRAQRIVDVYHVREPDRYPVNYPVGSTPAYFAGMDYNTVSHDPEKVVEAWTKFNDESGLDAYVGPNMLAATVLEALDYKMYRWPGHGLSTDVPGIQFVEGEYMHANEYDLLIQDPSDFWMRVYLPRIFGILEPARMLQPFTNLWEIVNINSHFAPYTRPEVQEMLQKLIDAGKVLASWNRVVSQVGRRGIESGYPVAITAFCKAPFDTIGDTLRGTKGIILDMRRQPDKLLEAIDVVADFTIRNTIESLNASKGLIASFPLHKGADGWMSDQQFHRFYWPSLKKVILGLINEGIQVSLFAEGGYESRLDSVNEFPKGNVAWLFDRTDMARAKAVLGDNCCISGNVPASLLSTGTPADIKEYCRNLIEVAGKGGGYILAAGAVVERTSLDNLHAIQDAVEEYGVYRR